LIVGEELCSLNEKPENDRENKAAQLEKQTDLFFQIFREVQLLRGQKEIQDKQINEITLWFEEEKIFLQKLKSEHSYESVREKLVRKLRERQKNIKMALSAHETQANSGNNEIQTLSTHIQNLECRKVELNKEFSTIQTEIIQLQTLFDKKQNNFNGQPQQVLPKLQETELQLRKKQTNIESKLKTLQHSLSRYESRSLTNGDFGTLISLFQLKPEAQPYILALNIIAEKFFKVRIVEDTQTAHKILEEYLHNCNKDHFLSTLRIWVLDWLQASDNTATFRNIQQQFGRENTILPLDLITFDTKFIKVFQRIFGNWLITVNDTVGEQVVSQFGVQNVTIQGSIITKGNLTGGYRPTFDNLLVYKLEFQQSKDEYEKLTKDLEAVRKDIAEAQHLLFLNEKILVLKQKEVKVSFFR
jgi:chromosome segregation ATPase